MQIYLVSDSKQKVHQFIYPDRVWEETENGWYSRKLTPEDHKRREKACRELVKNAVASRRVRESVLPLEHVEKENDNDRIH